jgi:hydroxyquinol 1,2-dioxygenase
VRNLTEENLTAAVLKKLEGATDARFKEVMTSLVRHVHAFVRETGLTEEEWLTAIQFLTATGQKCDNKRQEFILLSDTLGVSMLVDALSHRRSSGATESTVQGPFYVEGGSEFPYGGNIAEGIVGEPTYFSGRVLSPQGTPIAGAVLDVWSTDGEGWYDMQLHGQEMRARGKIRSNAEGRYAFWSVKPVSYPVPTDGPVGKMLLKMGRHPYRPAHTHIILSAPGYKSVTTHVFVEGDPYLESDAVFGVKNSLVTEFVRHEAGMAPDDKRMDRPFFTVNFDFGLVRAG